MKFFYENSLVKEKEITKIAKRLFSYINNLKELKKKFKYYNQPESFVFLPEDEENLERVENISKELKSFKKFILIGIGGSNLGTLAIYSSLGDFILKSNKRELLFLETIDSLKLRKVATEINENFAVILVSKSGKTLESLSNFFVILDRLKKMDRSWTDKIVIITDKKSNLHKFSTKYNLKTLFVPEIVNGRFSVFSSVGLLPLALAGVNLDELLIGAKKALNSCLTKDIENNPALVNAVITYYYWKNKIRIYNIFVFSPLLENLGNWYRQLIAESLGKEKKGITPLVSIGTRDLHSMYQLFLEGPKDKLTNFIYLFKLGDHEIIDLKLPKNIEIKEFRFIRNLTFEKLLRAIYLSVKQSYIDFKLPFTENILDKLDEENLGELMEVKMTEIIFLAKLLKVNAFNQPAVEYYKDKIRSFL